MNPRSFLDVAGEWAVGEREAEWRSTASRAYYAAFHVFRGMFAQAGFRVPPSEQAHNYLAIRLENSGHPDVRLAGSDLANLRRMRNVADYDLHRSFPQPTAAGQVQAAINLIQLADMLSSTPSILAAVAEAIKAYERNVLKAVTWRL